MEIGSSRLKNSSSILLKNALDVCVSTTVFYTLGYAFAFGDFSSVGDIFAYHEHGYSKRGFVVLQIQFAASATTIVSGALLERAKISSCKPREY